jgi:hypothetical protein
MVATMRLITMHSKVISYSSFSVMRAVILLLAGASLAATASAMSLRELRALEKSNKQGIHYANYYLVGVMEGVLEAHAHGLRNGGKPTICLNDRRLEPRMAKSLYDTELKRNADLYEADMPVQLVMVNALATVYHCPD